MKKFSAVMFDFDGTVTYKGSPMPSKKMIRTLINTALKVPIAFCTGRQIESFRKHGLAEILVKLKPNEKEKFLKNLYLVSENGAIGYYFDKKKHDFKEFYRAKWPQKFMDRDKFIKLENKIIKEFGEMLTHHKIVAVSTARYHNTLHIDEVYNYSAKIYKEVKRWLKKLNPKYEKYVHIGNSGIGVIVCPADADKDRGIFEFAKFLRRNHDFKIGKKAREILVIGDSAKKGGNDYYFLKGVLGTPFTVGEFEEKRKYPIVTRDDDGKRLYYEKGTRFLLEKYFEV
ncbi:MAG: hypothetical protein WC269_02945 [Candidatus Gracilibacteria bacterium]|jgi:hydroxymethylpyrimidine pyrophosphatase-like HAD family hydrolase